jgi:hypothetical protein
MSTALFAFAVGRLFLNREQLLTFSANLRHLFFLFKKYTTISPLQGFFALLKSPFSPLPKTL